jgi:DNA-binding beta-propeller fold protein YncE
MRRLLVALLLLSACSHPSAPRKAAEPAVSPPLTAMPEGKVVAVGKQAEGVAVDPITHLAAVGLRDPFTIGLVDTRSGVVTHQVPVAGHVRHLALQGDHVLVPLEDTGSLVLLHLPDGRLDARTPTDGYPHGVTAVGSDAQLVGNEHGGRVTLVRNGSAVASAKGFPQPGGVAATSKGLYVIDVAASTLTSLDPTTLARRKTVKAGDGPTHVVATADGNLVVVDTRGNAVTVYSPALTVLHRVALSGTPYGIAYDEVRNQVWVTLTATNRVVCLDANNLTGLRSAATVRQPNTVGVDSSTGTVVVASRSDGLLQLIAR